MNKFSIMTPTHLSVTFSVQLYNIVVVTPLCLRGHKVCLYSPVSNSPQMAAVMESGTRLIHVTSPSNIIMKGMYKIQGWVERQIVQSMGLLPDT